MLNKYPFFSNNITNDRSFKNTFCCIDVNNLGSISLRQTPHILLYNNNIILKIILLKIIKN